MTEQTKLRLQAWVDGELPPAEAAEVIRLTETDADTAAIVQEIKLTRGWLAGNELPRPVPESREFHWSKIERQLRTPDSAAPASKADAGWIMARLRWLVPAGLAAVLAIVLLTSPRPASESAALMPPEIDSPQEDVGTITFRSDSEQMTVVWVGNP